mgnify:CR=1 FL=1
MAAARREGKGDEAKLVMEDGSPAPAHVKPGMVPPDWSDVKVSLDAPDAEKTRLSWMTRGIWLIGVLAMVFFAGVAKWLAG